MDYIKDLKDQLDRFCKENILPFVEVDEEELKFRKNVYQGLGELGLCSMTAPEKYEGLNLSTYEYVQVLERLAYYSVPYAVTLSVNTMVLNCILNFGSDEQIKSFAPALINGSGIGAFCLSEANSGSDAASLQTRAQYISESEEYEISGTKMWITSGGIAEVYLVMARTGEKDSGAKGVTAFLVPKDTAGLKFGKLEKKCGWGVSPTRELIFEKMRIPKKYRIGEEGTGFEVAMSGLNKGRLAIAVIASGLAERAFDEAAKYTLSRDQFGKKIFDFQGLQFMLADMQADLLCCQKFNYYVAQRMDQIGDQVDKFRSELNTLSSISKLKSTDMAMKNSIDSVQLHGGVGYTKEFPVERLMREAKALQIVEGTNQVQKVVMAREIKKQFS